MGCLARLVKLAIGTFALMVFGSIVVVLAAVALLDRGSRPPQPPPAVAIAPVRVHRAPARAAPPPGRPVPPPVDPPASTRPAELVKAPEPAIAAAKASPPVEPLEPLPRYRINRTGGESVYALSYVSKDGFVLAKEPGGKTTQHLFASVKSIDALTHDQGVAALALIAKMKADALALSIARHAAQKEEDIPPVYVTTRTVRYYDQRTGYGHRQEGNYHRSICNLIDKTTPRLPYPEAVGRGYLECDMCKPGGIAESLHLPPVEQRPNVVYDSSGYGSGTHTGPRGGVYHYSKSGNKVYERHK
jgi:hypothetical protein